MFAEIDGNSIHYRSFGEGPPVVFVHGLGGTAHIWHGVMDAMQQHHHVVAMDLRGHGRSGGRGKFSIDVFAKDVRKLMEHLELPAAAIVGHSMGSMVAQHLAAETGAAVTHLGLVGGVSWFTPDVIQRFADRADLVENKGMDEIADEWLVGAVSPQTLAINPGLAGMLRDMLTRNDAAMYAKATRAVAKADPVKLDQIGVPTIILTGSHDRSTPLGMAAELHAGIPVSTTRVLEGTGHWAPAEAPGTVAGHLLNFLT